MVSANVWLSLGKPGGTQNGTAEYGLPHWISPDRASNRNIDYRLVLPTLDPLVMARSSRPRLDTRHLRRREEP